VWRAAGTIISGTKSGNQTMHALARLLCYAPSKAP